MNVYNKGSSTITIFFLLTAFAIVMASLQYAIYMTKRTVYAFRETEHIQYLADSLFNYGIAWTLCHKNSLHSSDEKMIEYSQWPPPELLSIKEMKSYKGIVSIQVRDTNYYVIRAQICNLNKALYAVEGELLLNELNNAKQYAIKQWHASFS